MSNHNCKVNSNSSLNQTLKCDISFSLQPSVYKRKTRIFGCIFLSQVLPDLQTTWKAAWSASNSRRSYWRSNTNQPFYTRICLNSNSNPNPRVGFCVFEERQNGFGRPPDSDPNPSFDFFQKKPRWSGYLRWVDGLPVPGRVLSEGEWVIGCLFFNLRVKCGGPRASSRRSPHYTL